MNSHQYIEERLWNYIDSACNKDEEIVIYDLIKNNEEWQRKYKEMNEMRQLMQNYIQLDEPPVRFIKNVMEAIAETNIAPATRTYINKKIIYGIATFFITLIAGLLIYSFMKNNQGETSIFSLPFDIGNLIISKYFTAGTTKFFYALQVMLGLILLDRLFRKKTIKFG